MVGGSFVTVGLCRNHNFSSCDVFVKTSCTAEHNDFVRINLRQNLLTKTYSTGGTYICLVKTDLFTLIVYLINRCKSGSRI